MGKAIQSEMALRFKSAAEAARDLKISRSRLSSYTTGKSLPGSDFLDLIREKWGVSLVGRESVRAGNDKPGRSAIRGEQVSLFDRPVTLRSDIVSVKLERKGSGVAVKIELSVADLKIA